MGKESAKVDKTGVLSSYLDVSDEKFDLFLKLLSESDDVSYTFLYELVGGKHYFLRFIDILAGRNIKIPNHVNLLTMLNKIDVWLYLRQGPVVVATLKEASTRYRCSVKKALKVYCEMETKFGDPAKAKLAETVLEIG